MSPEARAALGDIEEINELPIPHRDFALDRLALTRATDDLAPILREAHRVLRPGGYLFLAGQDEPDVLQLAAGSGFTVEPHFPILHTLTFRKLGT